MPKKKTAEDYHVLAELRGFKWLGTEVPTVDVKTTWECSAGHLCKIRYSSLHAGYGCPICAIERQKERNRLKPADYHALAKKRNFKWLGPEVANVKIKTSWECKYGHRWSTPYRIIKGGSDCPYCACKAPKTSRDYHAAAEKRGFKWLGPKVRNVNVKTTWECQNGHQWQSPYSTINGEKAGCPYCSHSVPLIPDDYHALAESRGFKWLGPQVRINRAKTIWECDKGHQWKASYSNIKQERGCPICYEAMRSIYTKMAWSSGTMDGIFQSPTSIEIETAEALDALNLNHESQYRPNGYSRPYDEFVPPNILVEIQGDYWHGNPLIYAKEELNETQRIHKKRDAKKAQWAEDNDFMLIEFWEHEIREYGARALIEARVLPLL